MTAHCLNSENMKAESWNLNRNQLEALHSQCTKMLPYEHNLSRWKMMIDFTIVPTIVCGVNVR